MRPVRSIVSALLVAGVALTGCAQSQPEQSATPTSARPSVTAAAPTTPGTGATTASSRPTPTTTRPGPQDPVCAGALSWGSGPKQASGLPISSEIYQVRAAGHDSCDRVVFDINGLGRIGYSARYVQSVHADPSDQPVPVAGGAALQVTIQAPDFSQSGHQPWRTAWRVGDRVAGGWTTLREVRFAGSFEHVTTFAVGVRSKRPFRVLVLPDTRDHVTRVAIDIAH